MTKCLDGQLEIDPDRGVIYFHRTDTGQTLLRICRLPSPIPIDEFLDITFGHGVNWQITKEMQDKT